MQVPADVRAAFRTWGRSVFGAPRRLESLISAVDERDEVMTRVATRIVRRDLVQNRIPSNRRAKMNGAPVSPATIDPFNESLEDLRRRTEHGEPCIHCGGGGLAPCPGCTGSGRERCNGCGGSGQMLRHYKKSSKYVRCTVCRGSGTLGCGRCGATGSVACAGCGGGGEQLVWWSYGERVRMNVSFSSDSAILLAHPLLREERFLAPNDLGAFTLYATHDAAGPIALEHLAPGDQASCAKLTPALDARSERVQSQQLLRFGVTRRDVSYEMCGTTGKVVLSGVNLIGSTTSSAVTPIRRRLVAWGFAALALLFFALWTGSMLGGPTPYFDAINRTTSLLLFVGVTAALIPIGGLLRALRPGFRFWPIGLPERIGGGVFVSALLVAFLFAYVSRPRVEDARSAVAARDVGRAMLIVEALQATRPSAELADIVEEARLIESERLPSDARLAALDAIAAKSGARSDDARTRARALRLEEARAALERDDPRATLEMLEKWRTAISDGPDLADLRGRAFDRVLDSCGDDTCRYKAARSARDSQDTPERRTAAEKARTTLINALTIGQPPNADMLLQVRSLRALARLADNTAALAGEDVELRERAHGTESWAAAELAKIQLIGAPADVVDEILQRKPGAPGSVGWQGLDGVAVHASIVTGQCKGLYVVGATPGSRALSGREVALEKLLAQATGRREAKIHRRATSRTHEVTRWTEGATPVMARWNGDALMELRIGDASP